SSPGVAACWKAAIIACISGAGAAAFQQAATPGDEHATLAKGAGTWKATVTSWPSPGAPPMTSEGVFERQLILGGRVMEESYKGDVMGMPFEGHSMLGFDNVTWRWWTMWVDNMSTGPMVLWGAWDESEKAVVYEGTTPDPMSGQLIPMKTVVRHPSADEEQMTMFDLRTGEPVKTMEIIAKRQ
ncbi:MAG: DUF1579 domain-containing protein, partial [Acidobacteriota bacterium]